MSIGPNDHPKPANTGSLQVAALTALYSVWPTCPPEIAKRFVKDRLGIELDGQVLLVALEKLGLAVAEDPNTEYYRLFVECELLQDVCRFGVSGKSTAAYVEHVAHIAKHQLRLPKDLVAQWVGEHMQQLAGKKHELAALRKRALECKQKLREMEMTECC